MRRTLLICGSVLSLAACAGDAADDALVRDGETELAAVTQGPWIDDPVSPPASDDPWDEDLPEAESDDDDPWLDPPRTPARPTPASPRPQNPAPEAGGYDFEESKMGWTKSGSAITNATRSTAQRASGQSSLEVTFAGAGNGMVTVLDPPIRPGARVSFKIYVPAGARLNWIQPYVQRGASENWAWTGAWTPISGFRPNAWTTVTLQAPPDARSFGALGVQFETAGQFQGRVYIDDVQF